MNAATASVAPARIDALDGLRALAMTAVVAQHCHLLPFGWTGVSEEGLLGCIAALVDSAELRARLGDAAREEALSRFSRAGRSEALIESYRTAAAQRDRRGHGRAVSAVAPPRSCDHRNRSALPEHTSGRSGLGGRCGL